MRNSAAPAFAVARVAVSQLWWLALLQPVLFGLFLLPTWGAERIDKDATGFLLALMSTSLMAGVWAGGWKTRDIAFWLARPLSRVQWLLLWAGAVGLLLAVGVLVTTGLMAVFQQPLPATCLGPLGLAVFGYAIGLLASALLESHANAAGLGVVVLVMLSWPAMVGTPDGLASSGPFLYLGLVVPSLGLGAVYWWLFQAPLRTVSALSVPIGVLIGACLVGIVALLAGGGLS